MRYETIVQKLVTDHIDKRRDFTSAADLLKKLGCRVMNEDNCNWENPHAFIPVPGHEDLIRNALLGLLRVHVANGRANVTLDGFGIIDGLAVSDRWRLCLESIDDAYRLAALLINLSINNYDMEFMREAAEKEMLTVINGWLRPFSIGEFTTCPSARTLVVAMFGEAWASLVMDTRIEFDGAEWDVGGIALRERPLFLHGVLPRHFPCQPELTAMALPALDACP